MALNPRQLQVIYYPDPILRKRATVVPEIGDQTRAVAERMLELMRQHEGIGLAAVQVGLPWRMFVADVPPPGRDGDEPGLPPSATAGAVVYINPVLSSPQGAMAPMQEGCLSLPDIQGEVLRSPVITITATDLSGREFMQTGSGLLARCWQHEVDHLDGVLIIDRMTQISRLKNRSAIKDLERAGMRRF